MSDYSPRMSDNIIRERLEGKGAVLIQGPKWCGKTTSAEQIAKSVLYMDDPEEIKQNLQLADMNPKRLLEGETPRLIDEWQLAPKLWDAVRFECDHREGLGHFILTGSAVPADKSEINHTGTGRFAWITMHTMSLFESGDSSGDVKLSELFKTQKMVEGSSSIDIDRLAFLVCRGGWPETLFMRDKIALTQASDYYQAVVEQDVSRVDHEIKNPEKLELFLRALARHQGTQAANTILACDIVNNDSKQMNPETIARYNIALQSIFVVEDMPAWNPNLRSKTSIRTSHTRYFTDPSIAVAALAVGPDDLIDDLNTFGFLFETLCIRDLRVYSQTLNGKIYHYRDKNNLECDAVVHLRNGKYGLVEIKLGGDKLIDEGAKTLLKLAGKIDTKRMKEPSFMMVLTGIGSEAYQRKDGVLVVPIGSLRD